MSDFEHACEEFRIQSEELKDLRLSSASFIIFSASEFNQKNWKVMQSSRSLSRIQLLRIQSEELKVPYPPQYKVIQLPALNSIRRIERFLVTKTNSYVFSSSFEFNQKNWKYSPFPGLGIKCLLREFNQKNWKCWILTWEPSPCWQSRIQSEELKASWPWRTRR